MTLALHQFLTPGARAAAELTATADMLVPAFRHWFASWRDLPGVVATIVAAGLAEEACVRLLHPLLLNENTSVGASLFIRHLAPSRAGEVLTASAVVRDVGADRATFEIEITSSERLIARVEHTRVVIARSQLLAEHADE